MIEEIKAAVASHEKEPGIVGYALIVFVEGGDVCLDAGVSEHPVDVEYQNDVSEAIADIAEALGFDEDVVVLQ